MYLYQKVAELFEISSELEEDDYEFIDYQMARVNRDEHMTSFTDKEAERINALYEEKL